MSGVGSRTISRNAAVLLDLAGLGDLRPEVGDRRSHHDDVGRGRERFDRGLHLGGSLDRPGGSAPGGVGRSTVDTSVTRAPSASASAATA